MLFPATPSLEMTKPSQFQASAYLELPSERPSSAIRSPVISALASAWLNYSAQHLASTLKFFQWLWYFLRIKEKHNNECMSERISKEKERGKERKRKEGRKNGKRELFAQYSHGHLEMIKACGEMYIGHM